MFMLKGLPSEICKGCKKPRAWGEHQLCPDCLMKIRWKWPYGEANRNHLGKKKARSFSIEFEVANMVNEMIELANLGYIPTRDSSLGKRGVEWKSPIYHGVAYFARHAPILDKFAKFVNHKCGTHIHVGLKFPYSRATRYEFWAFIFDRLTTRLRDQEETEKVWGRYFNRFAKPWVYSVHYGWVTLATRYPTVEWRLPKYINSVQFIPLLKFVVTATDIIEDGVFKYDTVVDRIKIMEKTADRVLHAYNLLVKEVGL